MRQQQAFHSIDQRRVKAVLVQMQRLARPKNKNIVQMILTPALVLRQLIPMQQVASTGQLAAPLLAQKATLPWQRHQHRHPIKVGSNPIKSCKRIVCA